MNTFEIYLPGVPPGANPGKAYLVEKMEKLLDYFNLNELSYCPYSVFRCSNSDTNKP